MFGMQTAMRLSDVTFKTERVDGETHKVVGLTLFIQPFTPDLANALNVKGRLFSLKDGEPLANMLGCDLAIDESLQRMTIRLAPDQSDASAEIPNVSIERKLSVRRDKEGPVYNATVRATFDYPSANDLLFLASRVNETDFFEFAAEQGDLLPNEAKDEATA